MTSPNLKGVLFQSNGFQCLAQQGTLLIMQILSPTPDALDWEMAWDPVSDLVVSYLACPPSDPDACSSLGNTVLEHLNFRDYWCNILCGGRETQMHTHEHTRARNKQLKVKWGSDKLYLGFNPFKV